LSFRKAFFEEEGFEEDSRKQRFKNLKGGCGVKSAPAWARHSRQSTLFKKDALYCRLLAGSAGIHVDFHADRHFNDLRCFPGHFGSPCMKPDELRPANKVIRNEKFASGIFSAGLAVKKMVRCTILSGFGPVFPVKSMTHQ
jgi:hypothetical protein